MEKPLWERESFFKVMIGDFQTRLTIPPCFHKQFCGEILVKLVLRSREGRRWTVELRREGKNLFFGEGWECFVADLTIQLGEFLLFVYDGSIGFDVKIYGITGCEKKDHTAGFKVEETEERVAEEREMGGQMEAKTSTKLVQRSRHKVLNGRVILGGLELYENERALKSARSFKSNRPFFITTYRESRRQYMTIPISFMRECDLNRTETIILKDPKGRSWTVRIAHWIGRTAMTRGWPIFGAVNHLTEGDVCVFEFLEAGKALRAHIFRAKESTAAVLKKCGKNKKREEVLKAERPFRTDARFASIILKSKRYVLNIPSHITKGKATTNINKTKLCDPYGRVWSVNVKGRGDGRVALSRGWLQFCEANHIQEGDVCVFELTGGIQAMDVQIRRPKVQAGSGG